MISYIFKNKYKNAAVIFFAAVYFLIQIRDLRAYGIIYGYFDTSVVRYAVNEILKYSARALPVLLILVYMLTLKREYRIKQWLFPAAFAVLLLTAVISAGIGVYQFYNMFSSGFFSRFTQIFTAVGANIIILAAYVLSFIGSLSNFKRVVLLRIGLMISVVSAAVFFALDLRSYYSAFSILSAQSALIDFLSVMGYSAELLRQIITLLFYGSMFILTLSKKSEYIDITPFIEARKNKKEMKKARRAEREQALEAVPPEAPEGYWCCMGCGKILPDSEDRCECGYKNK